MFTVTEKVVALAIAPVFFVAFWYLNTKYTHSLKEIEETPDFGGLEIKEKV